MKICHIITRLPVGGAQENTLLTCEGLAKRGHNVYLISGNTKGEEGTLEERAKEICKNFIIVPELIREISPKNDIVALYKIYRILKKENFDIVHTHTSKAGVIGRISAKISKTKVIIHTPHGHVFHSYYGFFKTKIFWFLEKICALFCDKIICLTETEKKEHIELGIAKEDKFEVIASGIDFEKFKNALVDKNKMKEELNIEKDKIVIGYVGRLADIKGVSYLIKAFSQVVKRNKNVVLVCVGDGPQRKELEKQAEKLNITEYVKFLGIRHDIPEILSCFDIFVMPSLNEGMGKVVIEAQLMGLPVVASYIGGIKDLIVDNKTGIFVKPKDSKDIAEKIIYLIENPQVAKNIGYCAKENVKYEYSSEYMVNEIEKLYLKLKKN